MSSKRVFTRLVNALAMMLIAVGCGGSSDETTSSISGTEFMKKADAVCRKASERLKADFAAFAKEKNNNPYPSLTEFEELITQVIAPSVNQKVAELRALGSPKGDEREVEAILAATEEGLKKRRKPDESTCRRPVRQGEPARKAYGLKVCGSTR